MAKADSVHSTPPINTSPNNSSVGLRAQERKRETALRRIAELRERASEEIVRLIDFLDASDPYAATELEEQIDDAPCDGDELEHSDGDDEPTLGWTVDGYLGNTGLGREDLEAGAPARPPQDRTAVPGADRVQVERSHRRFLRGLPADQAAALSSRRKRRGTRDGDVLIR